MNNLESLKEELIAQKTAIESKGGNVAVLNLNPSPSEITDGINTIVVPEVNSANAEVGDVRAGKTFFAGSNAIKTGTLNMVDTSIATATEADVTSGKTFFAGNDTLKTGTSQSITGVLANATVDDVVAGKTFYAGDSTLKTGTLEYESFLKSVVYFTDSEMTQPDRITARMPSYCSRLPRYFAWQNLNPVDFYFSSDVARIPTYSFYGTKNFTFPNFTSLTNLTTIETYAFSAANKNAFDLHSWPSSLKVIDSRAFLDIIKPGTVLVTPPNLERLGSHVFASSNTRIEIDSISIPSYTNNTLPQALFYFLSVNGDFTPPSCVTTIGSQFNMRGSFNNVTIPATCTKIENYAFGSNSYDSVSAYHMNSFTFLSETPPAIGTDIIATQHLANSSFRIYVPDTAVQAYKAVSNLSQYSAYIVGESERP